MTNGSARIRLVYFGTPAYAVPALRELATDSRFEVALVVTQPDRPAGRGRGLSQPRVKIAAIELGLPVYQPESLRGAEARDPLIAASADLFVVAAYGSIFGPKTLAIPPHGCLNLHGSLLPKYRGASPVTAAILAGDAETGVTLMQMDPGIDTGGIVSMSSILIDSRDTTATLTQRLAVVGADLALAVVPDWIDGVLTANAQPNEGASIVRPLVKADGWIEWSKPAEEIERQIRAMQPWPRAFTSSPRGDSIQILRGQVRSSIHADPGTVRLVDKRVRVACGEGSMLLERVQPAGSPEMDAEALIQGRKIAEWDVLGATNDPGVPPPLIREL